MILAAALLLLAAGDLALELRKPGEFVSYTTVRPGTNGSSLHHSFRRVGDLPADDPRRVSAVEMSYRMEGAAIRLDVRVLFGRFDPDDTPRSLEGVQRETVGSYLVPLETSVRLGELARFGVEPFEVRTVPAKPDFPNPPFLDNRTTTLDVVGVDEDRTTYEVKLRNVSRKSVIALEVRSPHPGGYSAQGSFATLPRVLIAPGALYTMDYGIRRAGRRTPAGLVEEPRAQELLVISAVVFDDGSYDGDPQSAAPLLASFHGLRLQLPRIVSGLESLLHAGSKDPAELRTLASSLPEEPSESEVDTVAARVGTVPRDTLARALRDSFRTCRVRLDALLKSHERNTGADLRGSLERLLDQFREELRALP